MRALLALLLVLLGAPAARAGAHPALRSGERTLDFPRFGRVTLYGEEQAPARRALFLSGDGGWNQGVVEMARALAAQGTLVVGIDTPRYLQAISAGSESCSDFAVDLESLSQAVQKRIALPGYEAPVLVGYSSGATLAYATLAQAPPNTFRGALSLGFCPDLKLPKPPCRRGGLDFSPGGDGILFAPTAGLTRPWVALQGEIDQVCAAERTSEFVQRVAHGEIVRLPKVGHGFSVPARWLTQLRASFARLADDRSIVGGRRPDPQTAVDVEDLPLVEVSPAQASGDLLAIVLSGDGGWASLDREVAGALAARGIPVVGLDSLRYFWTRRTPDEAARALERIATHYLEAWKRKRLLLIGYSRGADVLPFLANRLPGALRARTALVALLGPARSTTFEFHLADWLGSASRPEALPTLPEVQKLRGTRILCVYGSEEAESLCTLLDLPLATLEKRPGAHHLGGDYPSLAARIAAEAGS